MELKFGFLALLGVAVLTGCQNEVSIRNPLQTVLLSDEPKIKGVMDSLDRYEVQIMYTHIDRIKDSIIFTDYEFQVDTDAYFYPASTVKFPIAVLALEKLNESNPIGMHNRFYVEGDTIETTFAKDVSSIFAISDNEANNRLFELLGQDGINERLKSKGVAPVRIAHRLSVSNSDTLITKPLVIYLNDSTTTITSPLVSKPLVPLHLKKLSKGIGYYAKDSLIQAPFDFGLKNYYPIKAQHGVLKRVLFPEKFKISERFNLSSEQLSFLLSAMSTLPRALGFPAEEYYDSYGKFFMFGDTKEKIPEHIKIYNKVGYAYGTLTDCSYITDLENGVEFLLTATILANNDGIFNDDRYEYDNIGIPFLAELGRQLYKLELQQTKK